MESENKKIDWIQIIITAVITGLISIIVAIIVFYYTEEKTELIYEEFPVSRFESNSTKLSILNYSIKNVGDKTANQVLFSAIFPPGTKIKEPNIKLNNSLGKIKIKLKSDNQIIYEINSLFKYDYLNISLLTENLTDENKIKIELRSNEGVGKLYEQTDDSISPTVIYIVLILLIVSIVLIFVLILAAKKTVRTFSSFKKTINNKTNLENQKIQDITNQGVEYCDMGMVKKSIKILLKAKYMHPESCAIHSNLGRAYAKKGDMKKAEAEFKIAEGLIKDDIDKLIFNYTKAHYYALNNDKTKMLNHLQIAKEFDSEKVIEKMFLDQEFENYREDKDFLKLDIKEE